MRSALLCIILVIGFSSPVFCQQLKAITNSIGMKLVLIPAGTFVMGSPEDEENHFKDEPQHSVTIGRPFQLGKMEVTQEEFQQVMGFNPSEFVGSKRLPVEMISWFDAVWFCNLLSERDGYQGCYRISQMEKDGNSIISADVDLIQDARGYRLPTEAEWEYACRAGSQTPFSFGVNITPATANYDGTSPYGEAEKGEYRKSTIEVDSLNANAWGLFHMHGNVREWCQDWYGDYSVEPVSDPTGPAMGTFRVFRGGGWNSYASRCCSAVRFRNAPDFRFSMGFRVAMSLPGKKPESASSK